MSSQLKSSIFSCPFPRIAPRDTSKGSIVRIGLNTKSLDTSGCCLCPKFFEFMKVHAWRPWLSVGSKRLRHKNSKIATFISESHSMSVNLKPKLCKWRHLYDERCSHICFHHHPFLHMKLDLCYWPPMIKYSIFLMKQKSLEKWNIWPRIWS